MARFAPIAVFGGSKIDRKRRPAAAAFLSPLPIPLVGQEVFQRRQQERAKPSTLPLYRGEIVLFQEPRKERLGEVPRIVGVMPASAYVLVERVPVGFAQSGQCGGRLRRAAITGRQHNAPASRGKPPCIAGSGLLLLVGAWHAGILRRPADSPPQKRRL